LPALRVAGVALQIGAAERGEGGERRERHVLDALHGESGADVLGDAALTRCGVTLRRALGQREVRRALAEAGEPDLVQPGRCGQDRRHRQIAAGTGEERAYVVVE
jgi:hypothetical protein